MEAIFCTLVVTIVKAKHWWLGIYTGGGFNFRQKISDVLSEIGDLFNFRFRQGLLVIYLIPCRKFLKEKHTVKKISDKEKISDGESRKLIFNFRFRQSQIVIYFVGNLSNWVKDIKVKNQRCRLCTAKNYATFKKKNW